MSRKHVLCAVKSTDPDGCTEKVYVIMCRIELKALKPQNFVIAVFENIQRIWRTTVSVDLLEQIALENNEAGDILTIFEDTLRTLNMDIGTPFVFEIIDEKLLWKKKLREAKYLYGSFDLTLVEEFVERDEIIREYLLFSASNAQKMNEKLGNADKRLLDVTEQRDKTLRLLEEAVAAKEQCEKILMEKFVKILNAKKRRIAELLAEEKMQDPRMENIDEIRADLIKDDDCASSCKNFEESLTVTPEENKEQISKPANEQDSGQPIDDSHIEDGKKNSKLFVAPRTRSSKKT